MITTLWETLASALLNMASGMLGVSVDFLDILFKKRQIVYSEKKQHEVLSEKIKKLTTSLEESTQLMAEIETEFQKQQALAKEWEEKADTSKVIAEMHQGEIDAVAKVLASQLQSEGKKSDRKSFVLNALFCVLGILGGYLASKWLP